MLKPIHVRHTTNHYIAELTHLNRHFPAGINSVIQYRNDFWMMKDARISFRSLSYTINFWLVYAAVCFIVITDIQCNPCCYMIWYGTASSYSAFSAAKHSQCCGNQPFLDLIYLASLGGVWPDVGKMQQNSWDPQGEPFVISNYQHSTRVQIHLICGTCCTVGILEQLNQGSGVFV